MYASSSSMDGWRIATMAPPPSSPSLPAWFDTPLYRLAGLLPSRPSPNPRAGRPRGGPPGRVDSLWENDVLEDRLSFPGGSGAVRERPANAGHVVVGEQPAAGDAEGGVRHGAALDEVGELPAR